MWKGLRLCSGVQKCCCRCTARLVCCANLRMGLEAQGTAELASQQQRERICWAFVTQQLLLANFMLLCIHTVC